MKKPEILAVSGVKNSGKTTLITKLIPCLTERGGRVAVIKHDGHDFEADVKGTDSYLHKQSGAYATAVFSDFRYMLVKEQKKVSIEELCSFLPEADIILLEGFKYSNFPKIEVIRKGILTEPVCDAATVWAYVTDVEGAQGWKQQEIPCFSPQQPERLAEYLWGRFSHD